MYTAEEIKAKQAEAEKYRLSGAELLNDMELVQKHCNGIGAEWMPEILRQAVSALNPSLRIAADIHDIRYGIGGTEADRAAADAEFESNGLRLTVRFRWYDPRRCLMRYRVRRYAILLRTYGALAYTYTKTIAGILGIIALTALNGCALAETVTGATRSKTIAAGSDTWGGGMEAKTASADCPVPGFEGWFGRRCVWYVSVKDPESGNAAAEIVKASNSAIAVSASPAGIGIEQK